MTHYIARIISLALISLLAATSYAQDIPQEADSAATSKSLGEVVVTQRSRSRLSRVTNTELIGKSQLVRAACCNLGESFTTNPSVDVSYSDASTGAKQIKLLGLGGTYVQMLTENVPNLRGAAIPYSLGFIPGPWMQSIQVSKGASSVKNGYESITGQINIEYLKPQATDGVRGNIYFDSELKLEANIDGSIHLTPELSTSLLLHYEDRQKSHDMNMDGFLDMPKIRQYDIMNRWAYVSPRFISQLYLKAINDKRRSGQWGIHLGSAQPTPYLVDVDIDRYELQWKNAIITNPDNNASIALMLHGSYHDQLNGFGMRQFDINHKNGYAQLMYETDLGDGHNLAAGASLNHDYFNVAIDDHDRAERRRDLETTAGAYAQYTFTRGEHLTLMGGLRIDRSSRYGWFITPRLHLKYSPTQWLTLRASAGKGSRTPHPIAENIALFASNRAIAIAESLDQEEAWNYGASAGFHFPLFGRQMEVNLEYYTTRFRHRMVVNVKDYDTPQNGVADELYGGVISFENLNGKSFSHTLQIDATYPLAKGLTATAAWRFNDSRTTYDGRLRWNPFTPRFKGLLTLGYVTPLELWHFDVTAQLIGHGEMYDGQRYPTFGMLQAQVTREFRHFAIYVGGENLTNYKMKDPIRSAHNPWLPAFDATQIWGPVSGIMGYIGIRFNFEKD